MVMKNMIKMMAMVGLAMLPTPAAAQSPSTGLPPHSATVVVEFNRAKITGSWAEGYADSATQRIATVDDPVRIASVSKLVMMLGIDRLEREGKINLQKDVSDYLGWQVRNPNFPAAVITLEHLLSHTSSLTDDAEYIIPAGETVRQRLANPKAWNASHAPGTRFQYVNLNFPVVASVLEKATGERFDRLMERLVFKPNKIDACFNWSTCSDVQIKRAVVLRSEVGRVRVDDLQGKPPPCPVYPGANGFCDLSKYQLGDNGGMFSPQGGVRISMKNLAKLGHILYLRHRNMLRRELRSGALEKSSAAISGESEKGFYCRYIRTVHIIGASHDATCKDNLFGDGKVRIGHAGEAYGVRSGLWVDPRTGRGVAFFTSAVPDDEPAGVSAFTKREERVVRTRSAQGGR